MNPNFMTNMALSLLKTKNPQMANMIESMMSSGKSPQEAFKELTNNGKINPNQLAQAKEFAQKQFGIQIPDEAVNDLSKNSQNNSTNRSGF